MGDELAGVTAFKMGYDLTAAGAYDVVLVGGAFNAERPDLLLFYGFGQYLWHQSYSPVGARPGAGGCILGSMSAFLVLEEAQHARARGALPWCRVSGVALRHSRRAPTNVATAVRQLWNELAPNRDLESTAVISGATGIEPATAEELAELSLLSGELADVSVFKSGSVIRSWDGGIISVQCWFGCARTEKWSDLSGFAERIRHQSPYR